MRKPRRSRPHGPSYTQMRELQLLKNKLAVLEGQLRAMQFERDLARRIIKHIFSGEPVSPGLFEEITVWVARDFASVPFTPTFWGGCNGP